MVSPSSPSSYLGLWLSATCLSGYGLTPSNPGLLLPLVLPAPSPSLEGEGWDGELEIVGSGFGCPFLLGSPGLHFSSTHSSLAILKSSPLLLLPFLTHPLITYTFALPSLLHMLTPLPSFRDSYVLCPREWNFLVTPHHPWPSGASPTYAVPPPSSGQVPGKGTETSLFPSLPFPCLSSPLSSLLSPPTLYFCPLSFAQGVCWGRVHSPYSLSGGIGGFL